MDAVLAFELVVSDGLHESAADLVLETDASDGVMPEVDRWIIDRTLGMLGQSLGGQFVLFSALTRPDLFFGHVASNPALHRNLDWFLEWRGEAPMPTAATRLFLAEAEFDDERFRTPALKWIAQWSAADREKPFRLETRMLSGHTHLSAVTEAFRLGVQWLFEDDSGPGR